MKRNIYTIGVLMLAVFFTLSSCLNDLDTRPIWEEENDAENVFSNELGEYTSFIAKIYAGLAISGNKGGDDQADVEGVDGGSQASFLRGLWNLQELPSDLAHCVWVDVGIEDFNYMTWAIGNPFIKGFYYRLFYQIGVANEFLRETTEGKLSDRGVSDADQAIIKEYRAEARFLRALAYYHLLDMFRNVPFITEESAVGAIKPPQTNGVDLFKYIEEELLECSEDMLDPFVGYNATHYGRAHKAAAWTLLSRLYLNAEVYTGQERYTDCITYSKKVLGVSGYALEENYKNLFVADNDQSKEIIFPIRYEGNQTQTWGGMTFLICSTVPPAMKDEIYAKDAWNGNRAKYGLVKLFNKEANASNDTRSKMLHPEHAENERIIDPSKFTDGVPVVKFVNLKKDGTPVTEANREVYTDFPYFRLGEVYLNLAEAVLKNGQGATKQEALAKVNELRARAYDKNTGYQITEKDLTLDFILDERAREFFFEAHRRTDLIRHNKLTTGTYLWDWKGGVAGGKAVDDKFNIYPLPADDTGVNTGLEQNPGY